MYAISNLKDGQPVSYRAIDSAGSAGPGEMAVASVPPYPIWQASSSSMVSNPAKFDDMGIPLPADGPPAPVLAASIAAKLTANPPVALTASEQAAYDAWNIAYNEWQNS